MHRRRPNGGYTAQPAAEPQVPSEMCGLWNLGNTCFFNSVCQGLVQTPPLMDYLTGDETAGRVKGELSVALCIFLRLYQKNKGKVMSPEKLWEIICVKHPTFRSYDQQDAHELLLFVLNGLEAEYANRSTDAPSLPRSGSNVSLDSEPPASPSSQGGGGGDADGGDAAGDAKKKKKKKKKVNNIISKIFRGTLESVVLCKGCGARSVKSDDYFRDLSMEISAPLGAVLESLEGGFAVLGTMDDPRNYETARARVTQLRTLNALPADPAYTAAATAAAAAAAAGAASDAASDPHSPTSSAGGADPEVRLTKREKKLAGQRAEVVKSESELRGKYEREEARAIEQLAAQHMPTASKAGVTACCMKGVHRYTETFGEGPTLARCFESFFFEETMDEHNLYDCGKCKKSCQASKQLCISSTPAILTVHLKRFFQDFMTGTFRKNQGYVAFPLALKLDPYMSTSSVLPQAKVSVYDDPLFDKYGDRKQEVIAAANYLRSVDEVSATGHLVYKLYAVVAHDGSINSGHYFSYTRPYDSTKKARGNTWYRQSDAQAEEVSVFEVLSSSAYLLMYERV